MVTKTVEVVEVETIKGGKADRIVLHYKGTDNTTWKIGALAARLVEDSRKVLLAATKGDYLAIVLEKEGNYWNLITASPAAQGEAPKKSYQPSGTAAPFVKSKETDTRIQVMNALTNAVASLGAGKSTKEYKDRVLEFVALGSDVTELVLAGGLDALKQSAVPEATPEEVDAVTKEVGF